MIADGMAMMAFDATGPATADATATITTAAAEKPKMTLWAVFSRIQSPKPFHPRLMDSMILLGSSAMSAHLL